MHVTLEKQGQAASRSSLASQPSLIGEHQAVTEPVSQRHQSHRSWRMVPAAVLCPPHAHIHTCIGMFCTHNTYTVRGKTHIHMTDKIFMRYFIYLFCGCAWGRRRAYIIRHSLRLVDNLLNPVLSSCHMGPCGFQAWQELHCLTSSKSNLWNLDLHPTAPPFPLSTWTWDHIHLSTLFWLIFWGQKNTV